MNAFWSSSDLKRAERLSAATDVLVEATTYYEQHEDEFVSDYAASSPEEDFSESFVFFVLGDSPERGTLAREKVDFFNRYPVLQVIRYDILENK